MRDRIIKAALTDKLLSCQPPVIFQRLAILAFHHLFAECPTVFLNGD